MKIKVTESESNYFNLEKMTVEECLLNINTLDHQVAPAIQKVLHQISPLVALIIDRMKLGGRLFYMGAGTSGRLGILDASECPPTFGVSQNVVLGLIAGGDGAIRKAVEFAEDSVSLGWEDLQKNGVSIKDVVIGLAASGTTPYVVNALQQCQRNGITTGCITCNMDTPLSDHADYPIEVIVGPEFVTGSTRMKAGTAQKLVLNMISTTIMIGLGKVLNNKMVDMQLANNKLVDRGIKIIAEQLSITKDEAKNLLLEYGSVRAVINNFIAD